MTDAENDYWSKFILDLLASGYMNLEDEYPSLDPFEQGAICSTISCTDAILSALVKVGFVPTKELRERIRFGSKKVKT